MANMDLEHEDIVSELEGFQDFDQFDNFLKQNMKGIDNLWWRVALALKAMSEKYEEGECGSFKNFHQYCLKVFGFKKMRVEQLIRSAYIYEILKGAQFDPRWLPTNECQLRYIPSHWEEEKILKLWEYLMKNSYEDEFPSGRMKYVISGFKRSEKERLEAERNERQNELERAKKEIVRLKREVDSLREELQNREIDAPISPDEMKILKADAQRDLKIISRIFNGLPIEPRKVFLGLLNSLMTNGVYRRYMETQIRATRIYAPIFTALSREKRSD